MSEDNSPPPWSRLHLWQIQSVRDLLLLSSVALVLTLGYVIRVVTVPMLIALLLAYLTEPLCGAATRRISWLSREAAAVSMIILAVLIVTVPVTLGAWFGAKQTVVVANTAVDNVGKLNRALTSGDPRASVAALESPALRAAGEVVVDLRVEDGAGREPNAVAELLISGVYEADRWVKENAGVLSKRVAGTGWGIVTGAISAVSSVSMLVFSLFLTAFFFFFFSTGWGRVLAFWEDVIPTGQRARTLDLAKKMDRVVAGFVRGRLTIAAIQAAIFVVGYALIGVPGALPLGIAVGALSLVPYVALLGIPVAILLMFFASDGSGMTSQLWWILAAPTALYMLVQVLDDYVLTPRIQGKSTDLDTPSVLFASIAGGALAGTYGLLLAIPVAACAKILLREIAWPRFQAWARGERADPLPLGSSAREPERVPAPPSVDAGGVAEDDTSAQDAAGSDDDDAR